MNEIHPLPAFLVARYQGWKDTVFPERKSSFEKLVSDGQHPHAMIISCCDSRVDMSAIFGAVEGELFTHRIIASLVPPFEVNGPANSTAAAVEFAVTVLEVPHLIVVGHSQCGGVAGCHAMCTDKDNALNDPGSFVGRWVDILRPGFDRLDRSGPNADQLRALEQEAVILSLENLMTFPFVKKATQDGSLALHGLWIDIGTAALYQYDAQTHAFSTV